MKTPLKFLFYYFTLGNSGENKAPPLEISQKCITFLRNSKAKNQDPQKFHMIFPWSRCLQWNIKWDETHLVLYSWEIGYLVNYQFCELQGLKGVECGILINLYQMESYVDIRPLCKPISKDYSH